MKAGFVFRVFNMINLNFLKIFVNGLLVFLKNLKNCQGNDEMLGNAREVRKKSGNLCTSHFLKHNLCTCVMLYFGSIA